MYYMYFSVNKLVGYQGYYHFAVQNKLGRRKWSLKKGRGKYLQRNGKYTKMLLKILYFFADFHLGSEWGEQHEFGAPNIREALPIPPDL